MTASLALPQQVPNSHLSLCIFLGYGFKMRIAVRKEDHYRSRAWQHALEEWAGHHS